MTLIKSKETKWCLIRNISVKENYPSSDSPLMRLVEGKWLSWRGELRPLGINPSTLSPLLVILPNWLSLQSDILRPNLFKIKAVLHKIAQLTFVATWNALFITKSVLHDLPNWINWMICQKFSLAWRYYVEKWLITVGLWHAVISCQKTI